MNTATIQQYETQSVKLIDEANAILIFDDATRELATEFTNNTRKAVKAIEAELRPDIDAAHTLHKNLLSRLQKLTAPFKTAQGIVDKEIKREWLERDRIRQEEERKVAEKVERERREQEAELAREAEALIDDGDMEGAEALLDMQIVVEPVLPVPAMQRTIRSEAGSATVRKDIRVELVDKLLVIKKIADGELPGHLVDVNLGEAKRYAKACGLMVMPGFRITDDAVVSGRIR